MACGIIFYRHTTFLDVTSESSVYKIFVPNYTKCFITLTIKNEMKTSNSTLYLQTKLYPQRWGSFPANRRNSFNLEIPDAHCWLSGEQNRAWMLPAFDSRSIVERRGGHEYPEHTANSTYGKRSLEIIIKQVYILRKITKLI